MLVTEGHGPAQRLAELLHGAEVATRVGDLDAPPEAGIAQVSTGILTHGFSWPSARLAVLSEADLVGQRTGGGPARCGCRAGGAAASTRCG